MANVVVVDSNPIVRRALADGVQSAVQTAALFDSHDANSAMEVVRSTPVDVIVIDAGLDAGIDAATLLLAVAARHPRASILMRSPTLSDAAEARGGIAWVCATDGDVSPLVGAIREAVSNRGNDGWSVADMDLVDVTSSLNKTRWSGALSVRDGRRSGVLVMNAGNIVHAEFEGKRGDAAAAGILRSPGGTICECDPPKVNRRTVIGDTAALIAETLVYHANHKPEDAVEITEDDLVQFMGLAEQESTEQHDTFQLFSDDELAELALDDAMAIPLSKKRS